MLKTRMNETGPLAAPPVRAHGVVLGPQVAEREPRAAAALMDQGGVLDAVEDGFERILHGQDKAGRELLERPSGVHQGRRIGQEFEA